MTPSARLKALAFAFSLLSCSGCSAINTFVFGTAPPPPMATGTYASMAVNSYPCAQSLTNSLAAQTEFNLDMNNQNWSNVENVQDQNVTASSFTSQYSTADLIYFNGHGDSGEAEFSGWGCNGVAASYNGWGVGTLNGFSQGVNGTQAGVIGSRTKWIILDSSSSVAGQANSETSGQPAPRWDANWPSAFGGSLHGIYGYWVGPGQCVGPGNVAAGRVCDISDDLDQEKGTADSFVTDAFSGNETVHNAWVSAAIDNQRDGNWAIWEDVNNLNDHINNTNNSPSNTPYFYWAGAPIGVSASSPISIAATTFTVNPVSLANQSINDSAEVSQASSVVGGLDSQVDNGSSLLITKGSASARHLYAASGAVVISGLATNSNVPESTAYSAAAQYVTNSFGMPSDAVLTSARPFNATAGSTGAIIPTAWEFIWHHSSGLLGSDAIKVVINAVQTSHVTCTKTIIVQTPHGTLPECGAYTTTYTYATNLMYSYRQWRTTSSRRSTLSNGAPNTSPQSIDALTASTSLPAGVAASVTNYFAGYWTDNSYTPTSQDGAIPAWIYVVGSEYYAVDAVTGQLLGDASM